MGYMPPIVVVVLSGHLTETQLTQALDGAAATLRRGKAALLVDCRTMEGYDAAARELFVAWNRKWRFQITSVAIVTEKILWHVVVSAMALASGQRMKAFVQVSDAEKWVRL